MIAWREVLARRGSATLDKELECRIDGPCRVPAGVMTVHGDLTWYFYTRAGHRALSALPAIVQCEHSPGHKPERGVWAHNEEEARDALQLLDVVAPSEPRNITITLPNGRVLVPQNWVSYATYSSIECQDKT